MTRRRNNSNNVRNNGVVGGAVHAQYVGPAPSAPNDPDIVVRPNHGPLTDTPIAFATPIDENNIPLSTYSYNNTKPPTTTTAAVPNHYNAGTTTYTTTTTTVTSNNNTGTNTSTNSNYPTGDQILKTMKQRRKQATVNSGLIGGLAGLLILGPIGAIGIGAAAAILTKKGLKKEERELRRQYQVQGTLNRPVSALPAAALTNRRQRRRREKLERKRRRRQGKQERRRRRR